MSRKSNKMQISIYNINNDYKEEYENWDTVIDMITIPKEFTKYTEQKLKKINFSKGFNSRLFLYNSSEYLLKKLVNFYGDIVCQGEPILRATKKDVSTILFVYDNEDMFAITTGLGYFVIQDYINYEFGLKVMGGLIDKNNNVIKNISDKGISGSILASTRYFRGSYNFSNEDDFGKLFKEICASIPQEIIIKKLGFTKDEIKKNTSCIAKSSFKINKTICMEKLYTILVNMKSLMKIEGNLFNSLTPIYNKGIDKNKINDLNTALVELIYTYFKQGNWDIPLEISNKEFDDFYKADYYNIFYDNRAVYKDKIEDIDGFKFLLDVANLDILATENLDAFREFIDKITIYSYDEGGVTKTGGTLLQHISGEIEFDGKVYFCLDGFWFQLNDNFIDELNSNCITLLSKNANNILQTAWPIKSNKDENGYIDDVCTQEQCLKVHPVKTDEQLELCDLIKVVDDMVYFIHIKDGFDHKMRDLSSQVYLSARRIFEIQRSGNTKVIEDYYDKISKKYGTLIYNKEQFMNLFKKSITFVLAFRATSNLGSTVIENPEKFKSNIAKYSLISLIKEMDRNFRFNLNICEIRNN